MCVFVECAHPVASVSLDIAVRLTIHRSHSRRRAAGPSAQSLKFGPAFYCNKTPEWASCSCIQHSAVRAGWC